MYFELLDPVIFMVRVMFQTVSNNVFAYSIVRARIVFNSTVQLERKTALTNTTLIHKVHLVLFICKASRNNQKTSEPPRGKTNNVVSDQV